MKSVDVAIIGGGAAGSLAATMLGRAGVSTALIDIHPTYPEEFRCEKVHDDQVILFRKVGLWDAVATVSTPINEIWVVRRGYLVGKKRGPVGEPYEYGVAYEDLVNVLRRQIPPNVEFICAKATDITNGPDTQKIMLSNGDTVTARLIVSATGLNNNIVGETIPRVEISKTHSISIGFDLGSKAGFEFPALTYYGDEKPGPVGYLSLFPIGSRMRANLFVYRNPRDEWCREVRKAPLPLLLKDLPRLRHYITSDMYLASEVRLRPADLYIGQNYEQQPGLVLIGDSFATSCPAAGTGLNKILNDVIQLCSHIPDWLATPGMGTEKIQTFYNDPVKTASDAWSLHEAQYVRSLAIDSGLRWRVRRVGWMGFDLTKTTIRQIQNHRELRQSGLLAEVNREAFSSSKIGAFYARQQGLEPDERMGWKCLLQQHGPVTDLLDLGVGAGRTVEPLQAFAKNYVGVDFSSAMVAICRQRFPDRDFRVGDARDLSGFPAGSFDAVFFSYNGIDYVDHEGRLAILAEIRRVLRSTGKFLFSTHNRDASNSVWRVPSQQQLLRLGWSVAHLPWVLDGKIRHLRFRGLEYKGTEYEIRNDTAHGHRMMTYYIDAMQQRKQLEQAGFNRIEIFDITGRALADGEMDAKSDWLTYLCSNEPRRVSRSQAAE